MAEFKPYNLSVTLVFVNCLICSRHHIHCHPIGIVGDNFPAVTGFNLNSFLFLIYIHLLILITGLPLYTIPASSASCCCCWHTQNNCSRIKYLQFSVLFHQLSFLKLLQGRQGRSQKTKLWYLLGENIIQARYHYCHLTNRWVICTIAQHWCQPRKSAHIISWYTDSSARDAGLLTYSSL